MARQSGRGGGGGGGGSCYPTACATDMSGTPSVTIAYTLPDTTAPTISIAAPTANAVYSLGTTACTEGAYGPGLKSCIGTVRSGGLIDTQSLGRVKFTVTAISNDGESTSKPSRTRSLSHSPEAR